MAVRGLREVKAKLTGVQRLLGIGVKKGMSDAGEFVKRESDDDVPVDTGELKASGYVRLEGDGVNTKAFVGYSAPHALMVHEDLKARHEQGHAKFLEKAARQNRAKILELVAQKARLE